MFKFEEHFICSKKKLYSGSDFDIESNMEAGVNFLTVVDHEEINFKLPPERVDYSVLTSISYISYILND